MPNYKCYGCDYVTTLYSDIKRHMERKKDYCYKDKSSSIYLPDEMVVLSLFPENTLKNDDIIKFKNTKNLYRKNLLKLFKKMNGNYLNNKYCTTCNITFDKVSNYKKHIILDCYYNDICKECNITNTTLNNSNNITNITNVNNIINNIGTVNINNFELKVIPFDDKWDISDIASSDAKFKFLCSDILYSNLLITILEKKQNINVLYSKGNDKGIVYKNDNEKYVLMNLKDIVDKSMVKLTEHLTDLNEMIRNSTTLNNPGQKPSEFNKISDLFDDKIKHKFSEYHNNPETNNHVVNIIKDIYNEKAVDSYEIFNKINNNSIENIKFDNSY